MNKHSPDPSDWIELHMQIVIYICRGYRHVWCPMKEIIENGISVVFIIIEKTW